MWFFSLDLSQRLTPCLLTPSTAAARGPELPAAGCHHRVREMVMASCHQQRRPASPACLLRVLFIRRLLYVAVIWLWKYLLLPEVARVGSPGECYRWPPLQGMEARCQSPPPVDKMAKTRLGERSAGKLQLIHMELKFKQSCGRHVVNCDGVFVADMV